MSNGLLPLVRHQILCDDVRRSTDQPDRVDVLGLVHAIRSLHEPAYPHTRPLFAVFVQLTECHGPAMIRVDVFHPDSETVIASSPDRRITLSSNPLEVETLLFRLVNCRFPEAGVYEVRLWYNGEVLAQQPLRLR